MKKPKKIAADEVKKTLTFHFYNAVTIVARKYSGGAISLGFAYASHKDQFNRKIGRVIAMGRCLHDFRNGGPVKHSLIASDSVNIGMPMRFELLSYAPFDIMPDEEDLVYNIINTVIRTLDKHIGVD